MLEENRIKEVKEKLSNLIPSYKSNSKIVDHLYEEQLNFDKDFKSPTKVKEQENKVINLKTK